MPIGVIPCNFAAMQNSRIAVGTAVTGSPLHRSLRAGLPHKAPALGHNAQTVFRIRMHDAQSRHPATGDTVVEPLPIAVTFVTATLYALPPISLQSSGKCSHGGTVTRYAMIVVIPLHHTTQPLSRFGHRTVHPPPQLFFELLQLRSHPLGLRFAAHNEASILPRPRTKMREAQEVKRLWFAFAFSLSIHLRVAAKLDQPGLLRVEFQMEDRESLAQFIQTSPRFDFLLESDHESSSPGDSHPQALTEPDLSLSIHTAPMIQPLGGCPSYGFAWVMNSSHYWLIHGLSLDHSPPLLQIHYRSFSTHTG